MKKYFQSYIGCLNVLNFYGHSQFATIDMIIILEKNCTFSQQLITCCIICIVIIVIVPVLIVIIKISLKILNGI
jgi:hypothetical protein